MLEEKVEGLLEVVQGTVDVIVKKQQECIQRIIDLEEDFGIRDKEVVSRHETLIQSLDEVKHQIETLALPPPTTSMLPPATSSKSDSKTKPSKAESESEVSAEISTRPRRSRIRPVQGKLPYAPLKITRSTMNIAFAAQNPKVKAKARKVA